MEDIEILREFYINIIDNIDLTNLDLAYSELIDLDSILIGVRLNNDEVIKQYYDNFKDDLIEMMNK